MTAEHGKPEEMSRQEQLDIIESHWYEEAKCFRDAGRALRTSVDGDARSKALAERTSRLERCDALEDAHSAIRAEMGAVCVREAQNV